MLVVVVKRPMQLSADVLKPLTGFVRRSISGFMGDPVQDSALGAPTLNKNNCEMGA